MGKMMYQLQFIIAKEYRMWNLSSVIQILVLLPTSYVTFTNVFNFSIPLLWCILWNAKSIHLTSLL